MGFSSYIFSGEAKSGEKFIDQLIAENLGGQLIGKYAEKRNFSCFTMYIFKWCILWVSFLLFPYLSTYSETVCTFSYYFSVISTQLDSQIGTLHQNAFPSRTKHFETLPFGKQRKRLSRQKFRISLFFPYSITHFRLPRWCWRTKDALKIIRAERKERGKKKSKRRLGVESELMRLGVVRPR